MSNEFTAPPLPGTDLRTESEARRAVCPVLPRLEHCVGSECMAWRPLKIDGEWRGYCGMAGTPAGVMAQLQSQMWGDAGHMLGLLKPDG